MNHEALVTNISQVHLRKHISTCITDSQNSVISRSDSEKMRVETLYHLTDLAKPKLFSNLPCTIRLVYDVRTTKDNEKTEDIPVSWNPFLVTNRHVMS